jgi:2-polyprenyl-3-methyl-5-hydroxy-6-metoxy-1,4-benzoquinol methylase
MLNGNRDKIVNFAATCGIDFRIVASESLPLHGDDEFDIIILCDILEHLHYSPRVLLLQLVELLRPLGFLLVTVPNAGNIRKRLTLLLGGTNYPPYEAYYWSSQPWRGHSREYVKGDLIALSRYLGLETVTLTGCHHMMGVLPASAQRVYRAITAVFRDWRDSWMLLMRKPQNWAAQAGPPPGGRF